MNRGHPIDRIMHHLMPYWWRTRCKPFDNRRGWCLRRKQWNGRCTRHINQASQEGEQL